MYHAYKYQIGKTKQIYSLVVNRIEVNDLYFFFGAAGTSASCAWTRRCTRARPVNRRTTCVSGANTLNSTTCPSFTRSTSICTARPTARRRRTRRSSVSLFRSGGIQLTKIEQVWAHESHGLGLVEMKLGDEDVGPLTLTSCGCRWMRSMNHGL